MKTIALRFSDNYSRPYKTIVEHQKILREYGFVWYGKLGPRVSFGIRKVLLENEKPRILLVHSGKNERYWAYFDQISIEEPELFGIPSYYRDKVKDFHTWFRLIDIVEAEKNVLTSCFVISSGTPLSQASRRCMNPYFIIDYKMIGDE